MRLDFYCSFSQGSGHRKAPRDTPLVMGGSPSSCVGLEIQCTGPQNPQPFAELAMMETVVGLTPGDCVLHCLGITPDLSASACPSIVHDPSLDLQTRCLDGAATAKPVARVESSWLCLEAICRGALVEGCCPSVNLDGGVWLKDSSI